MNDLQIDNESLDWLAADDFGEESAQATEVLSLDGIHHDLGRMRDELVNRIFGDRDTSCEDEKYWKSQMKYTSYKDEVTGLLHQERRYMDRFIAEAPTNKRKSPENLLQFVLEKAIRSYPDKIWLCKIKFLLKLITDEDSCQLSPKWGPKPLHAAAKFDIISKEEWKTHKTDLTHYMCNLMGDKAATEICDTNEKKENILHLAIRHDLIGVRYLVQKADRAAFKQQRISRRAAGPGQAAKSDLDDGNTPLHDAMDIEYFIRRFPFCTPQKPANPGPGTMTVNETLVSSNVSNRVAIAATTKIAQQQANQTKPRAKLVGASQDGQTAMAGQSMCSKCKSVSYANHTAIEIRRNIIHCLLKRERDALTIHNTAGLSPYLYLTENQRLMKGGPPRKDPLPTNGQEPPEIRRQTTKYGPKLSSATRNNGDERDTRAPDLYDSEAQLKKEKKQEQDKIKQVEVLSDPEERSKQAKSHAGDVQDARGVKEPMRNSVVTHTYESLTQKDIGSDQILRWLEEITFRLGGYKKAYDCLFRDRRVKTPSLDVSGEVGRQRRLTLEGRQRVKRDTADHFDFLVFEPMMASIVLSLEYTQEELRTMPSDDDGRLEMWSKDEDYLKAVFKWLKVGKNVHTVLSLTVKDNPNHYCSDDTVEECLKDLKVRYLNWNRPHICANSYTLPKTLIEVSLYWSGLNAVLWGWSDNEGLQTLDKLQKIHIYVQRGAEVEDKKLKDFTERVKKKWPEGLQCPQIEIGRDEMQLRGSGKGNGISANVNFQKHSWIETAGKFAGDLFGLYQHTVSQNKSQYHVKVALLDDGVDPTYGHNGKNLHHAGWPLADSGRIEESSKSFYVSTNQHGSKMAWLVRKVCPFVTIYVAKLDSDNSAGNDLRRRAFSLQQATEAIEWATAQEVDIISMSWNAREVRGEFSNSLGIQKLENALNCAAKANILMFGAACDVKESSSSDKWVPCDSDKVWSIGATDVDYDPKKYVHMSKKVDYLFPGEHVFDSPQKEDVEVGNSGATALAAGLAAMTIFCMRITGEGLPDDKYQWMGNVMTKVFNSERNNKSVRVNDVLQLKDNQLHPLVQRFAAQKV